MKPLLPIVIFLLILSFGRPSDAATDPPHGRWLVGLSKIDITPEKPLRLSGYGSRDTVNQGVDTPLHVRAMALRQTGLDDTTSVLITVDSVGLPGILVTRIAKQIQTLHQIPRDQIVVCNMHTHSGPHLNGHLENIFETPIRSSEQQSSSDYEQRLTRQILRAVDESIVDLQPAELHHGIGETTFAVNRRVINDGRWVTFGVQGDAPVDHRVDALRITKPDGTLRGLIFNYACHCTTLTGDYNRINADWAGYAATALETDHVGIVALCTIGCGADANPEPRGTIDDAKLHGRSLAAEVSRIIGGDLRVIDQPLRTKFEYAALSFELPTEAEIVQQLDSNRVQTARNAQHWLSVLKRDHRLPASHPVPIAAWQFGDQLQILFLGGEVVADYALRLRRESPNDNLWITAYANDVPGYIASERMIAEGGYEYDRSGVYYSLPGPWASGTEDQLIDRIGEMLSDDASQSLSARPLSVPEAAQRMQVSEGYEIQCVAAEPLIRDPVNIAFGSDGRMWVAEMGDYPQGDSGGRIKVLSDTDEDGVYDSARTFVTDLPFPTGVMPWRDGVLISAAPNILFARDLDGDDAADQIDILYSGFELANPQHRINGFTYGLDHSLHLASGDNLGEIKSEITGDIINASGHDVQIWPDDGRIAATSGRSQFIRSRNAAGQWFGSDNSRPMFHFPIDDADLTRNPSVRYGGVSQQLFTPAVAPPVYPLSQTGQRFNDLTAAGRFSSACSAIIVRSPGYRGNVDEVAEVAMVCEPVHNLVHRANLIRQGSTYRAVRESSEHESEFLSSSDPWFRPVRVIDAPDGSLYVVDMYRQVIEHPEWIPEAWQHQLDLTAGSDHGRIYRITPVAAANANSISKTSENFELPSLKLDHLSTVALVEQLNQPVGARRDLVQQILIERDDIACEEPLRRFAAIGSSPAAIPALWILQHRGVLLDETLLSILSTDSAKPSSRSGLMRTAIQIARAREMPLAAWLRSLTALSDHDDSSVVLAVALALGDIDDSSAGQVLAEIAIANSDDRWIMAAVASSASQHAEAIVNALLNADPSLLADSEITLSDWMATATKHDPSASQRLANRLADSSLNLSTRMTLAASLVSTSIPDAGGNWKRELTSLYEQAVEMVIDDDCNTAMRCKSIDLVGIGLGSIATESKLLTSLLAGGTPIDVQRATIDALIRLPVRDNVPTTTAVIDRWDQLSPPLRQYAAESMLQRSRNAEILMAALEAGSVAVSDLSPAAQSQMTLTGSRSMRVRAERLFRSAFTGTRKNLVDQYYAQMIERSERATVLGNVEAGRAIFDKNCGVCHTANDRGQAIGPNLANLTDRRPLTLLTAILDPNQSIDPKYVSYIILADDDRILSGVIDDEIGDSLTLITADNRHLFLTRSEIVQMKSTGVSLMPEGFEKTLNTDQLRDLLEYLRLPQKTE